MIGRRAAALAAVAALAAAMGGRASAIGLGDRLKQGLKPITDRLPKNAAPASHGEGSGDAGHPAKGETLDPASDPLCDALDRSYVVTDDVGALAKTSAKCQVVACAPEDRIPTETAGLDRWLRAYSRKHVWLPVAVEAQLGASYLEDQRKAGAVLERGTPRADKLYARVDAALAAARRAYPAVPYDVEAHVVDAGDAVNAQASPGGHVFVTRAAARDLGDDALQLVLGHEVAHLAKRHMSKQLQQRILETEQGVSVFRAALSGKRAGEGKAVYDRLGCSFARYEQDQEAQADACAARALVAAQVDPLAAWEEYLRVRGTAGPESAPRPDGGGRGRGCSGSTTSHPDDGSREERLREAAEHHRGR